MLWRATCCPNRAVTASGSRPTTRSREGPSPQGSVGGTGDGLSLGASSLNHLTQNLKAVEAGPLPDTIVAAIDHAAEITQPTWSPVTRTL